MSKDYAHNATFRSNKNDKINYENIFTKGVVNLEEYDKKLWRLLHFKGKILKQQTLKRECHPCNVQGNKILQLICIATQTRTFSVGSGQYLLFYFLSYPTLIYLKLSHECRIKITKYILLRTSSPSISNLHQWILGVKIFPNFKTKLSSNLVDGSFAQNVFPYDFKYLRPFCLVCGFSKIFRRQLATCPFWIS